MAALSDRSPSGSLHQQLIESLAHENSASVEHVRELFEEEHARLEVGARVKAYVAVIATRLVRNALHTERNTERISAKG